MPIHQTIIKKLIESRIGRAGSQISSSVKGSIGSASREAEKYWKKLGPGLTTGAADDDPSGIATYSQVGARHGFMFLWLAIFTYPLMSVVQMTCAKIGLVTSRGLAANIRLHYPRFVLYIVTALLFAANTFNIGADLGAMAEATRLVFPGASFAVLVIGFTLFSLCLQIFTSYKTYARYLKYLALILFVYIFAAFATSIDWKEVLISAFIPRMVFDFDSLLLIAAVLGTTISPYLFFWQTSQEVEEKIKNGQVIEETTAITKTMLETGQVIEVESIKEQNIVPVPVISTVTEEELKDMKVDVWSGMFISNLVMFFIITVCGATLFKSGITNIETASDAALALQPLVGQGAYLLFAIGIIGTGLLAVPILAGSTSYALAESFSWKSGLHHRLREALAFYGVIVASMLVGLGLNFIGLDPIKALIYSAIANCLIAPIALTFIMLISGRKDIMGDHAHGRLTGAVGWFVVGLMTIVSVATVIGLIYH